MVESTKYLKQIQAIGVISDVILKFQGVQKSLQPKQLELASPYVYVVSYILT